jgi:hypothetical protein
MHHKMYYVIMQPSYGANVPYLSVREHRAARLWALRSLSRARFLTPGVVN